ncbi:MAG: copper homeostasis protein CutC [Lactobacillaceae bacterium]|jgi:copper homeostasis protein|nr:copper homeostasis protein CutC [Lactobacillaceae bacterium]
MLREVALDKIEVLVDAITAGVERVELNANLEVGGLTPADAIVLEAVELTKNAGTELVVMVRPRPGDFNYSYVEIEQMIKTLRRFRSFGVKAVTFGVLNDQHTLARDKMAKLMEAAGSMTVIFHMAFDEIPLDKQSQTLEWLARYGVKRLLTHGGQLEQPIQVTLPHLLETVQQAPATLEILPGGGVTFANAQAVIDALGVGQVHGSHIIEI